MARRVDSRCLQGLVDEEVECKVEGRDLLRLGEVDSGAHRPLKDDVAEAARAWIQADVGDGPLAVP